MRAALTLLGLLAAAGPSAQAADALELDAVPAWQGWSRPGRTTELELRVAGHGEVTLTIESAAQRVATDVKLGADRPARLRIPVTAAERVTITAVAASAKAQAGSPVQTQATLSLSEAPLLAWVSSSAAPPSIAAPFRLLPLEPSAVPASTAAFGSIDALVIDAGALAALDDEQTLALLGHLAACGRTVLVGATSGADGLFAAAAGCGGRAFGRAADSTAASGVLRDLLQHAVTEPPSARSLAALADPELAQWHQVIGVLAACAALLLLGVVFSASLLVHVALAGVVALAATWFVQSRPAVAQLVVWAEAGPQERLAQYRALQRTSLERRDAVSVDLLTEFANPAACRPRRDITWHWAASERRYAAVTVPGRLFESLSLCYAGSFPVARAVEWRKADDGRITVRNSGPSDWPAGQLAWQGELMPLPAVAPGFDVVADRESAVRPMTAVERQALARTPPGGVSILWPLDLGPVKAAPQGSRGWLLVAAAPAAPGGAP